MNRTAEDSIVNAVTAVTASKWTTGKTTKINSNSNDESNDISKSEIRKREIPRRHDIGQLDD